MRDFLYKINARIDVEDGWAPSIARENYVCLMDAFHKIDSISEGKLARLNSVRLYLKVITISDIETPAGACIEAGERNASEPRQSTLRWPHQDCPTLETITLWRRSLKQVFHPRSSSRTDKSARLELPLGDWIGHSHIQHEFY